MKPPERTPEELSEALEHRDLLLHVRAVLATVSGRHFFRYIFRHLNIRDLPELGLEGQILFERLGFLRASNAIFEIVAEASPELAGQLIAENEKERYARLYAEAHIGQG